MMNKNDNKHIRGGERGVALLPLVLVFSGLIVTVGLAFSAISIAQGTAVQSEYGASRALYYANSGLEDAVLRLARDHEYLCGTDDCYAIAFSSGGCDAMTDCVTISIQQASSTDERYVVAKGVFGLYTRILESVFMFDQDGSGRVASVRSCERAPADDHCF